MVEVRFLGNACVEIIGDEDHIIIDPNFIQSPRKGVNCILMTHEHDDHVDLRKIEKIRETFIRQDGTLKFYGPESVVSKFDLGENLVRDGDIIDLNRGKIYVHSIDCWKAKSCVAYHVEVNDRHVLHTADSAIYSDKLLQMAREPPVDVCFTACFEDQYDNYYNLVKRISPKLVIPYHFSPGKEGMALGLVDFIKKDGNIDVKYFKIGDHIHI